MKGGVGRECRKMPSHVIRISPLPDKPKMTVHLLC